MSCDRLVSIQPSTAQMYSCHSPGCLDRAFSRIRKPSSRGTSCENTQPQKVQAKKALFTCCKNIDDYQETVKSQIRILSRRRDSENELLARLGIRKRKKRGSSSSSVIEPFLTLEQPTRQKIPLWFLKWVTGSQRDN